MLGAVILFLLAHTRSASAATGRVVVVAEDPESPAVSAALVRIQGELVADGFDVIIDTPIPGAGEQLADAAERAHAFAAIGIHYDVRTAQVELRVLDLLTSKTLERRASLGGAAGMGAAETLAVSAVELLRASLLELLTSERARPRAIPPALQKQRAVAARFAQNAIPSEARGSFGIELGAGVLTSFSGVGPALLAVTRVQRQLGGPLALRLGVAGLGSEPRVQAPGASARVGQDLAELGLIVTVWSTQPIGVTASLAGGVLRTTVEGEAELPYRGRRSALWSATVDGGFGLDWHVSSRFDLRLETHWLLSEPYPVVRFIGDERATAGLPSLFETVTLTGWL